MTLPTNPTYFIAGGVGVHYRNWHAFTKNKWVLDMVKGLPIELSELPHQCIIPDSAQSDPVKDKALQEQIDLMLQQQIIEPASHSPRAYVSHMFVVR